MKTVWIGTIEEIFGYGLAVVEESEEKCYKALERAYNKTADGDDDYSPEENEDESQKTRFEKAFDYWGGCIQEVTTGKVYGDGFRN